MSQKEWEKYIKSYETELQAYIEMLSFINESTDDYLFVWDMTEDMIYFTSAIGENYALQQNKNQYSAGELLRIVNATDQKGLAEALLELAENEKDNIDISFRLLDRDGKWNWSNCRGKVIAAEKNKKLLLIGRICDTLFTKWEDPLTGLLNGRKMLEDFAEVREKESPGFFLMLGIDHFKSINDKYSRGFGNEILKRFSRILEEVRGDAKRIYRLDGDKFGMYLTAIGKEEVKEIYDGIKKKLEEEQIPYTISVGAVPYLSTTKDGSILYQFAENALDKAKGDGRNTIAFFSDEDYQKHLSLISLRDELSESVKNHFEGFQVVYQPQVCLDEYRVISAEALLRFHATEQRMVSPVEFIPILEQTGLISKVGLWVLRKAMRQCKIWRQYVPDFQMSVNLSYVQIKEESILEDILQVLEDTGLPGEALTLELTESMQLQEYRKFNHIFYQLNKKGIKISIDDFGTGYSNMSYLKRLNIDEIKIDRCFVTDIQESEYNYRLVKNMIELAKSVQISVCVEGVEQPEELMVLQELEPEKIQGYFFGKPEKEEVFFEKFIQDGNTAIQNVVSSVFRDKLEKTKTSRFDLQKNLVRLLDNLDEVIYVSDTETYEIYYLNRGGRKLVGKNDYKGQKCYQVLQGFDHPCPFCTNHLLNKSEFYIWEVENKFFNLNFIVKDKLIPWNHDFARMEIAIDITEKENMSQKTKEKLKVQETIVKCIQLLTKEENTKVAIADVLEIIGNFHKADRTYIFEIDTEQEVCNNTYEWCHELAVPQKDDLQQVPLYYINRWMKTFEKGNPVLIQDLEALKQECRAEWEILSAQGIQCLLAVPLFESEKLIGFMGLDNPTYLLEDDTILHTMSFFITDTLKRHKMEEKLEYMDYHDMLTGLYNRKEYIKDSRIILGEKGQTIGVLHLDINGLKKINDERGHIFGDLLLKQTAQALQEAFFAYDIYRTGGDEFAVICKNIEEQIFLQDIDIFLRKIETYKNWSVSIGQAWSNQAINMNDMIWQADQALYRNKEKQYRKNL